MLPWQCCGSKQKNTYSFNASDLPTVSTTEVVETLHIELNKVIGVAMVASRTHVLTIYREHPIWWPRSIIVQRHRLLRNLSIHSLQGKVIISLLSDVLPQFRDRKSSRSYLRYVGLMCSFTLIGRLYLSGKWLVVKNGHQNRHVSKEIGLCAQKIVVTKLRGPMWSLWSLIALTSHQHQFSNLHKLTQNHNLHDSQLLTGWNDSKSKPIENIACEVGSAHNRPQSLIQRQPADEDVEKSSDCTRQIYTHTIQRQNSNQQHNLPKVRGPHVITLLNQIHISERYMARLVVKNGHQKDSCHYECGLCAQSIYTILGSIVNIIGRANVIVSREWESSFWSVITFTCQFGSGNLR